MICIVCIFLILAALPFGYYFAGPVSIILASLSIVYLVFKRSCSGDCKKC